MPTFNVEFRSEDNEGSTIITGRNLEDALRKLRNDLKVRATDVLRVSEYCPSTRWRLVHPLQLTKVVDRAVRREKGLAR